MASTPTSIAALILAAGQGTRMKSRLAKVLHPIAGRPMLGYTLAAVEALAPDGLLEAAQEEIAALVGHLGHRVVGMPSRLGLRQPQERAQVKPLPSRHDFAAALLHHCERGEPGRQITEDVLETEEARVRHRSADAEPPLPAQARLLGGARLGGGLNPPQHQRGG